MNQLKKLVKKYLKSVDDELHYWDGVQMSDRENANDELKKFLKWLKENYSDEPFYHN